MKASAVKINVSKILISLICICSLLVTVLPMNETLAIDNQKAVLSLTFDDNPLSAYTKALPCMQNRSLPATVYCISNSIGYGQALTKKQILDLQNNYSWEIGSHTKNHTNLSGQSVELIEDQISGAYHALTALGAKVYGLAYPFGAYDDNAITVAEKYHVYARATQVSFCQNLQLNLYDQSRYSLLCSTWDDKSLEKVEEEIDYCISNKSWLIGLNHGIDGPSQMNSTTWSNLMEYIKSKVDAGQLLVKTVFEAIEYCRDGTGEMSESVTIADSDQKNLDFRRDVFENVSLEVVGKNVTNLLNNSGFEDVRNGSGSLLQYWHNDIASGMASLATNVTHSGAYCLLLNRTISVGNVISYTSDQNGTTRTASSASPGRIYTLSVWVNTNTKLAEADLAFFNGSNWIRSSTATGNSKVGWQRITVSSPCPLNADGVSVYLYIYIGSNGWAYFDDVMLTCDTDPPVPYVAGPGAVQTTDPRIKVGDSWYNYSGTLADGQEASYEIQTLLGGQTWSNAQIAGSRVAVSEFFGGARVLYVDKAWVTTAGDTILFEKLFDNTSAKAVIYRNVKIQFVSGVTYKLSESNTEGGAFYFAETDAYYAFNASQPYISYCTRNVTQASFSNEELIFTVGASVGSAGSAEIHVGSRGKPSGVNGASKWSYEDGTGTLTIDFVGPHSQIEVSWVANALPRIQSVIISAVIVGIIMLATVSFAIGRRHKNESAHQKGHASRREGSPKGEETKTARAVLQLK